MTPSCISFTVSADNQGQHVSETWPVEDTLTNSWTRDEHQPLIHFSTLGSPSMRNCWWSCSSYLETLSFWVVPCRWFRLHSDSAGLQERDADTWPSGLFGCVLFALVMQLWAATQFKNCHQYPHTIFPRDPFTYPTDYTAIHISAIEFMLLEMNQVTEVHFWCLSLYFLWAFESVITRHLSVIWMASSSAG